MDNDLTCWHFHASPVERPRCGSRSGGARSDRAPVANIGQRTVSARACGFCSVIYHDWRAHNVKITDLTWLASFSGIVNFNCIFCPHNPHAISFPCQPYKCPFVPGNSKNQESTNVHMGPIQSGPLAMNFDLQPKTELRLWFWLIFIDLLKYWPNTFSLCVFEWNCDAAQISCWKARQPHLSITCC